MSTRRGVLRLLLPVVAAAGVVGLAANRPAHAVQKTCPPCRQSLETFGRELHLTWKAQRVYVCCAGCAAKMQLDWDGYLGVMATLGEKPAAVRGSQDHKEPLIHNPQNRGVCDACMGGACELPEHKPR